MNFQVLRSLVECSDLVFSSLIDCSRWRLSAFFDFLNKKIPYQCRLRLISLSTLILEGVNKANASVFQERKSKKIPFKKPSAEKSSPQMAADQEMLRPKWWQIKKLVRPTYSLLFV